MIGDNGQDGTKRPLRVALEDTVVIFAFVMVGGLIAGGFPPTFEILYGSGLAAALAGVISWAKARGVQVSPG
ncbi:MAG: hypothetical protein LN413_05690 [Candidatus Thermoplasmatota archaeon]|nr:hypothetical protein [Candidatus Thermoplasmatota archaeon]